MIKAIKQWTQGDLNQVLVGLFGGIIVLSTLMALATDQYFFLGLPAVFLLLFLVIVDVKKVYWLLILCIPISAEIHLSTTLATDLPTEPLTVLMMGVGLLLLLKNGLTWKKDFLMHPISIVLLLHVGWIIACTIVSDLFLVSFKFTLAKIWYVVTFFFMTAYFVKEKKDFKTFLWLILLPLIFATIGVLIQHAAHGFSFEKANLVTRPFFRNHVNYAAILVLFLPFVYLGRKWYPKGSWLRRFLVACTIFFLVAIYLSYTRAAYLSVIIALGAYFVISYRFTKIVLIFTLLGTVFLLLNLYQNNSYMQMAPEFKKTVTHYQFDNLVAATAKGEDISTMERVYRWVAGAFIVKNHPWMGVGPGNFYNFYQKYSLNAFSTYVSNNPDRSGIHCYYLLMAVEQGIPGMLIFVVLVAMILLYGERIYHEVRDPQLKSFVMAILLSLIVIFSLLIINDMIETDKVGSFFFIGMALLINIQLTNSRKKPLIQSE